MLSFKTNCSLVTGYLNVNILSINVLSVIFILLSNNLEFLNKKNENENVWSTKEKTVILNKKRRQKKN